MKLIKLLIIIFSFNSLADSFGVCGPKENSYDDTQETVASLICKDPYSLICEKGKAVETFHARANKYFKRAADRSGHIVYERNKFILNRLGVTKLDEKNYDDVFRFHTYACIDDNLIECQLGQIEYDPSIPQWFQDDLEEQFVDEFYYNLNQELDPKIDVAHHVFNRIKSELMQVVEKELKGRVSSKKLKDILHSLAITKGVFSSSDKSVQLNFPFLSDLDRENIQMRYESFCYRGIKSDPNAMYFSEKIKNREFDITMFCPGDYLGGLEEGSTLLDIYNSMSLMIAHELGHQVNKHLKNTKVFKRFNECMGKFFSRDELKSSASSYEDEAHADFWAKRVIGKQLDDMKDSSITRKLEFIKGNSVILCGSEDDSIHHSGQARINRVIRMTRQFSDAFNCSKYLHKKSKRQVECSITGFGLISIHR